MPTARRISSLALFLALATLSTACRSNGDTTAPLAVDSNRSSAGVDEAPLAKAANRYGESAPSAPVAEEVSVKPGANERFLSDDLDVDQFVTTFEGESREIAVERDAIAAIVALRPGEEVADVGAGTGLFVESFSRAVGDAGHVYAVDISPGFIDHLNERIAKEGLSNTTTVLCTDRSAQLAPASVDAVFVCDTYHHFEYPRSTLASLHSALRPGGRLVVVDFERIEGESDDWVLSHVRAGKAAFRAEIEEAGFTFLREYEPSGLEQNYVLEFRRP